MTARSSPGVLIEQEQFPAAVETDQAGSRQLEQGDVVRGSQQGTGRGSSVAYRAVQIEQEAHGPVEQPEGTRLETYEARQAQVVKRAQAALEGIRCVQ